MDSSKDFTIGRIWMWKDLSQEKEKEHKQVPDVILPNGVLFRWEKMSLEDIGKKFNATSLLPNCDLVFGPDVASTGTPDERAKKGSTLKEFNMDIIYLKKAMIGGTINIDEILQAK